MKMSETSDKEGYEVIEADRFDKETTPSRIDLKTIDDIRL